MSANKFLRRLGVITLEVIELVLLRSPTLVVRLSTILPHFARQLSLEMGTPLLRFLRLLD